MNWTDLKLVLAWLEGVGAPFIVGYIVSLIVEYFDFWHKLPSKVRFVLPMIFSVLVSLGAHFLLEQTEFISSASPYFKLIAQAILVYLGSQSAYMNALRSGYTSSDRMFVEEDFEDSVE